MRVKWLPQANNQLRNTAKYIRLAFGNNAKESFILEIRNANRLIGRSPNIGIEEPLLVGRTIQYRSLVVSHLNKIVYSIKKGHIEVVALWDTRREPKKLTEGVE